MSSFRIARPTISRWKQRFVEASVEGMLRARLPLEQRNPGGFGAGVSLLDVERHPAAAAKVGEAKRRSDLPPEDDPALDGVGGGRIGCHATAV